MPLPYPTPSTKRLAWLKHQTREKKPADILSFVNWMPENHMEGYLCNFEGEVYSLSVIQARL